MILIDVGAAGAILPRFSGIKNKTLIAFEPDPVAFKDLQKKYSSKNDNLFYDSEISQPSQPSTFVEIAPLNHEIDIDTQKDLSSIPLSEIDFPKLVYMIIDKKIELEIKLLKDFPKWDFLPNNDLKRKTIEIFFDLNLAKRSCNKEQKVLKVPNTDVFRIAAPILLEKGISRIVCPENLIAL